MQAKDLFDFKCQLKSDMKPSKIKHFSTGSKKTNSLLTRFRTGRTSLNLHKFTIGQTDDPSCLCHSKEESPMHYILDCFIYTVERQTLFSLVEHYVPKFPNMNRNCKYELLISGLKINDPDYFDLNKKISIAVQDYINQTKRFMQHLIFSFPPTKPLNLIFQVIDTCCSLQYWNILLYIVFCKYFHLFNYLL